MRSERNFAKISHTRLCLYLTDTQLAFAIVKHCSKFVGDIENPHMQVEDLVHKLNAILSHGRSISTLLRNSDAKTILENSTFFQIYQSEEYQNRYEPSGFKTAGL